MTRFKWRKKNWKKVLTQKTSYNGKVAEPKV